MYPNRRKNASRSSEAQGAPRRRRRTQRLMMNPFDFAIPGNRALTVRRSQVTICSTGASGGTGFFFTANPSSSPNFDAEFGPLFSIFKAMRTTFRWYPGSNTNEITSGDLVQASPVYTVVDPAITTVPTTEADLMQYGSLKVTPMWRAWARTIRPSLAIALNSGNSYPPASNFWVSIGSDPQMNGLRMFVPDLGQTAVTYLGRMITTFEFQVNGTS